MQEVFYKTAQGRPLPYGVSRQEKGINFALFSKHATAVTLCLFSPGEPHPFFECALDPHLHKTGVIWHILIFDLPQKIEYGYRIKGPLSPAQGDLFDPSKILFDPYAKALNSAHRWGEGENQEPRGRVILDKAFDWQGDTFPRIPMQDLVIYEMHVRGLTRHHSSQVSHPGTFLGVIEKIPYLKKLGINAVELMPIHEFNECELQIDNPITHQRLFNFWGYSTLNFFSPMSRYASSSEWDGAINEFKLLVRELHKNKIEVILDVVYNHTAEGNEKGPTLSYRGIDNRVYYLLTPDGKYRNFSGTGNTLNCNHPVVSKLILDSLRYWVAEMHVDGFRFDLASVFTRDQNGVPIPDPPLVDSMTHDPILMGTKLIAEAWDAGGLYQVGSYPHQGRWAEWNGKYRDVVRKFIKGTSGQAGHFACALCGSEDLFGSTRQPYHSINFITAHDGFTLKDLVSYQEKHNRGNGEENRDGMNDNESWNCGEEGPTSNRQIQLLRQQQMRNFHTALMVSIGPPMLVMGNEYGHTRKGNNNAWCQDDELNWFLWDELEKEEDFFRFYTLVNAFRKQHASLRRASFLKKEEIDWHGHTPLHPDWSEESRFVAYTLKDLLNQEDLYIAFNAHHEKASLQLPPLPSHRHWFRVIDTQLPSPQDFTEHPTSPVGHTYEMAPYSALVLLSL